MPDGQVLDPRAQGQARRQSAALPVMGSGAALRVVLITSRETRRWVVPKGWIEPREQPHRSAAREAFEEAGLAGEADPEPIGCYVYAKRMPRGVVLPTEVLVFRFRVARLLQDWPERRERERRLFTPAAAATLVAEPGLAELLRSLTPARSHPA
ncbi:MAG TPA: NUDIX hydrolase [Falsiroseomonas sp.]|jgi:8-oxo-dGTP pyrophosphatase MutT (NUDIX family)|nr:NUDIX hydrolase [Falsiroseomonas sp.]